VIADTARRLDGWLRRAEQRPAPWLLAIALLTAAQISPDWYATPDGAAYLSIARHLAEGGPLSRLGDPQLSFPLGYPLLVSPAFLAGPRPFLLLSILHALLAVVFMLGVYRWARRALGPPALWVTAVVMANVNVGIHYRRTLSEAAFLTVTVWAVVALDALLDRGRAPARGGASRPASPVASLAAGALVVLLATIREAGLVFGAGFVVALLAGIAHGATSRRAAVVPLAVTAAAILAAAALMRPERLAAAGPVFAGRFSGYADAAAAVTDSFGARLHLRVTELGELLMPGMFKAYGEGWVDINTLVYAPLAIAVAAGWWMLVRRRAEVFAVSAPLYLGLHLAWPYGAGTRYLLPLLPLFVACLWEVFAPLRGWRRVVFAAAVIAHLGVAAGYWLIVDAPRARACAAEWPAVDRLAATPALASGAVMAAEVPTCVALMLELALDRPVQLPGAGAAGASVEWILAPQRLDTRPGFEAAARAGDYVLLHRLNRG
jgi:hypothetical protein